MKTPRKKIEIEYLDMVKHDGKTRPNSGGHDGLEDDGWLAGLRQVGYFLHCHGK